MYTDNNINYKNKYLKYKNKYLETKYNMKGGGNLKSELYSYDKFKKFKEITQDRQSNKIKELINKKLRYIYTTYNEYKLVEELLNKINKFITKKETNEEPTPELRNNYSIYLIFNSDKTDLYLICIIDNKTKESCKILYENEEEQVNHLFRFLVSKQPVPYGSNLDIKNIINLNIEKLTMLENGQVEFKYFTMYTLYKYTPEIKIIK
jgi:hypothetical protein